MTAETPRRPRADAARNSGKILRAAREAYAEIGPDAPMEEIARRAGVGIATLYRHFPNKEELATAALEQKAAEEMSPAIDRALADDDPMRGMTALLEAMASLGSREHSTFAAVRHYGSLSPEISTPYYEALLVLVRRAQLAGLVRADLVPDDLHRITVMLLSVLWTMPPASEGWKRYVTLVLDGLSPARPSSLPPAAPLWHPEKRDTRPA
ncbi:helix-turn-helix domain-containing protein [Amycolatopsis sp. NEAU-NG30]|uniref:Helix-turn-helix domain-containing protein n=1 Tax=Amycolatopsis melonis TaxID=3156488 RepID=A0ABV0LA38_9PSEU